MQKVHLQHSLYAIFLKESMSRLPKGKMACLPPAWRFSGNWNRTLNYWIELKADRGWQGCLNSAFNQLPEWPSKFFIISAYWKMLLCLAVRDTMPPKKWNPVHSIALYWPIFQSLSSHSNLVIFNKTLTKSCSSWLHASFDTFWVQIDRLFLWTLTKKTWSSRTILILIML